jgi:tetratricopeptide (TPR) repeat protein
MRRLKNTALLVLLLAFAAPAAQAASEFYSGLLRRGIVTYGAGRHEQSLKELRIAAFGLLDSVPEFETAQVYIALASDKLKRETDTRNAIQRILTAERVERRYASLDIPATTRMEFEAVAKKLLTSVDFERLHGGSGQTGAPPEVSGNQRSINDPHDHREQPTPAPVVPTPQSALPPSRPATRTTPPPAPVPAPAPRNLPQPTPQTPVPQPPPQTSAAKPKPAPAPALPVIAPERRIAEAETALARNDLPAARTIFRELLENGSFDHAGYVRLAEGLYRARAFGDSLRAFERAGALRSGEEPYHFYMAVAFYEMGRYDEAKRELAAALPFIEVTPDVARYRAKIEGAID